MNETMLTVALDCIRRGWHIFPCWPKTKRPMTAHGWHAATTDEAQIRSWWTKTPDANIAIACGPSGLAVLDIDHGLANVEAAQAFLSSVGAGETYMVRTGRRPEFGLQVYFAGALPDVGLWRLNGCEGQVKSLGGYVMAAGSVHPSGERYEPLNGAEPLLAPTPEAIYGLKQAEREALSVQDGRKIPEGAGRHHAMASIAGGLRAKGLGGEAIYEALIPINPAMCEVPLSDDDLRELAHGIARRYQPNEPEPIAVIGGGKGSKIADEPVRESDPWEKYHSTDQVLNAPPVTFLIDRFLTEDAITVIAAPVAQRKSILALNVVHSLVTGEPLFEHFAVEKRPSRVLYLCPEMGIQSFSARLKSIGLASYLGKTLFCTTMASDPFELKDLTPDELKGAVVVLDTAIRFLKGDESSAAEMSVFAATVFRLIKDGAASVLLLHHSKKGTSEAAALTLDNVMRGSGELGAFVACVWATRLQDGKDEYKTASYLENVKKRDFDSEPFQVLPVAGSYRLVYDAKVGVELRNPSQFRRDKDGKEEQALALIAATRKSNPTLSYVELSRVLKEHEIDRSAEWIRKHDKRAGANRQPLERPSPTPVPTTNTP